MRYRMLVLQILVMVTCFLVAGAGRADCKDANLQLQSLKAEQQQLITAQQSFVAIRQGKIPLTFQRAHLFPFALDDMTSRRAYMAALSAQGVNVPFEAVECEKLADDITEVQGQLVPLRRDVVSIREHWLRLPSSQLAALESLFHHWSGSSGWVMQLQSSDAAVPDITSLRHLTQQWQQLSGQLAQRLSSGPVTVAAADSLWREIMTLPDSVAPVPIDADAQLKNMADDIESAVQVLKTIAVYYHNLALNNDGLDTMLEQPDLALEDISRELHWLMPVLLMRFFENMQFEHETASTQGHLVALYSAWSMQLIMLIVAIVFMLRLATLSTKGVAHLQRRMLSRLGHGPSMRILNSLVWVIKPNAAWLVIWGLAVYVSMLAPSHWHIFRLLAPLGVVYALFRAVRVLSEWLLARMHSRVDQFVSQSGASRMHDRAGRFSVAAVVGWALLQLTAVAGGGMLHSLLQVTLSVLMWGLLIVTLRQYSPITEKFIAHQLAPAKAAVAEAGLRKPWLLLFWPALFVLAQLRDLVLSLHGKLSQFENYRTLSLRLLRLRLETAIGSDEEEKDAELNPFLEKSYRYWLLERDEQEQPLITLEQTLTLITEPVSRWFEGHQQDNVLLLHGEHGAGKTHLIRQLVRHHSQWLVQWMDVRAKTCTSEDVRLMLEEHEKGLPDESNGQQEKRLVVIDQTENLLLAQTGYFDGVRELFKTLHRRNPHVFYLVIMHGPSWHYLCRVFRHEHPFTHAVSMPRWTASEMRKLILSRHHASRRKLQYDDLLLSAMAGTEASSFRAADTRVFNLLWELSGGNPEMALHLWLGAASYEGRDVVIALPQRPAATFLSSLSLDACFILLALVTHKALNHEELALVTTLSLLSVEQTMTACLDQGVVRTDAGGRWRITPLWYGSVITHLSRKNMVYS
ncbi:hypothetical protein BTA51_02805 [Hahella sp. CCB-MM4]|uniref:ATP-binding protein n=1 Tax=Hahella sp. (strain CCB-MM4) TaxID=1926491 RepID=UPI000BD653CF|nr:ATP-binding protein [Hahella sp. CCB-MM4]OZG75331.1 hypothetical protein BTA51_02805 [Hahella sp. CCB-MM4]